MSYGIFALTLGITRSVWIFPFPIPMQSEKSSCWKDPKGHQIPAPAVGRDIPTSPWVTKQDG